MNFLYHIFQTKTKISAPPSRALLQSKQITILDHYPTVTLENKILRTLRKTKSKIKKLTRSAPEKFYGNPKKDLPLRPIVLNIGTVTYKTGEYFAKLFSSLGKSKYTTNNSK